MVTNGANGGGPVNESHGNCDTMTKPVKARGKKQTLYSKRKLIQQLGLVSQPEEGNA